MILINLTPHVIEIRTSAEPLVLDPHGPPARVSATQTQTGIVNGIPVMSVVYGAIEHLPEPISDVIYITSALVAACAKRADVLSPDTGATAIRKNGQVVAVVALVSHV